MAQTAKLLTEPIPPHRILREVLRHYTEFRALVTCPTGRAALSTGGNGDLSGVVCQDGIIEYGYWIYNEDGSQKRKIMVSISFWDLFKGLKDLSPRKREAIWYNVILDQKQRDVAKRMGITTVLVGQYVEQGTMQLAERYFAEESKEIEDVA